MEQKSNGESFEKKRHIDYFIQYIYIIYWQDDNWHYTYTFIQLKSFEMCQLTVEYIMSIVTLHNALYIPFMILL